MTGCVLRGAAALAALVCLALLPSCGRDPVFPENYASTYGQVSNCVYSIDHNLHHVKIYVSPEAVLPYCATENPLPDTTIIVKEEYDGDDDACTGPILGIKAARKEPGSAPSRCDWFWQDLKPNLHVLREGDIGSCTSCHSDAMYTPADCTALAVRNGPDCPLLCGNGRIDMGEACDDGAANSNTMPDACRTNCGLPYCSDGVTDVMRGETCDDGNTLDGDQCGHGCDAPPPVPATVDLGAAPSPAAWRLSAAGPVLAVGDFDGDGRRDVAFGDGAAATVRVVLGVDLPPAASPAAVDVALAAVVSVTGAPGSALGAAL
ncbi:MAG TPA: hypothetical protein VG389_18265, partial [Myxococcota bacterium]|nr:hypothetical protein [Myxococcota bacterium]